MTFREIYFTNWGDQPYIARVDYDGNNAEKLVFHDIMWPNGITIDFNGTSMCVFYLGAL